MRSASTGPRTECERRAPRHSAGRCGAQLALVSSLIAYLFLTLFTSGAHTPLPYPDHLIASTPSHPVPCSPTYRRSTSTRPARAANPRPRAALDATEPCDSSVVLVRNALPARPGEFYTDIELASGTLRHERRVFAAPRRTELACRLELADATTLAAVLAARERVAPCSAVAIPASGLADRARGAGIHRAREGITPRLTLMVRAGRAVGRRRGVRIGSHN